MKKIFRSSQVSNKYCLFKRMIQIYQYFIVAQCVTIYFKAAVVLRVGKKSTFYKLRVYVIEKKCKLKNGTWTQLLKTLGW